MNGKERMGLAMKGKKADQIPLMCQLSLGYLAQHFSDDLVRFWYTPEGLADAYIAAAEQYRFDGILVSISGRDPSTVERIASVADGENRSKIVSWKDNTYSDIPYNDFPIDRVPASRQQKPAFIEDVDPETITKITSGQLPDWQFNILEMILEKKGQTLSIHGEVGTAFEQFLELFDTMENGLMALIDDDEKAVEIMQRLNETVVLLALEQCRRGIDALKLSSPFAGSGFISKAMYERFVLPFEKEVIDSVHKAYGIPCYIHTCGAIGDRLDLMLDTGTDGLECLDPPPLGTVDLAQASALLGDRAFIKGNLDSVNELQGNTPEQVLEIARKRIDIGKKHLGGYILSTACSIAPDVPPENIAILHAAVAETLVSD